MTSGHARLRHHQQWIQAGGFRLLWRFCQAVALTTQRTEQFRGTFAQTIKIKTGTVAATATVATAAAAAAARVELTVDATRNCSAT